jgi:hypothetical protein
MIDSVREEIKKNRFKEEHVKLDTLISVLEKIDVEISAEKTGFGISKNSFAELGMSHSDSRSSDSSPSEHSRSSDSSPSDSMSSDSNPLGLSAFERSVMLSSPSDSSSSKHSGIRERLASMRNSSKPFSVLGAKRNMRSPSPRRLLDSDPVRNASIFVESAHEYPKFKQLESASENKKPRLEDGSKRKRSRGKKTRRKSPK